MKEICQSCLEIYFCPNLAFCSIQGRIQGAQDLGHLGFLGPTQIGRLSQKGKSMPILCVVPPQIYLLWCRLQFCDCFRSSTEIKAFPTLFLRTNEPFMGHGNVIFSWHLQLFRKVQKFSSLNFRDFQRFFSGLFFRYIHFHARPCCRTRKYRLVAYVISCT